MTLDEALRLTMKATEIANARGAGIAIAVVDAGGHLVTLHRMDGVPFIAAEVAWGLDRGRLGRNLQRPGRESRRSAPIRNRDHCCQRWPVHAASRGIPL
jgi:uncharacterized protein GlcG (DUF336 family)